eukprot:TRINITY_DN19074_c0_g1_i1.p1 TRINITY_DN19074_c0_g1~~TRINITY_DN19074_c0_g1_i1.p1  ORF type:complete len:571 (-),score=71.91 TRINITY_DN19074_c0_g1_i1:69-1718(-)
MASLQEPLRGGEEANIDGRAVERRLILSHAINKFGSKAWEFATPLLLVKLSGGRLIAPAVLSIVTTAAQSYLGPKVGLYCDRVPSRYTVVSVGSAVQALAVSGSLVVLWIALAVGYAGQLSDGGGHDDGVWFAGQEPAIGGTLFCAMCLCAVVENLGCLASSISVERDWVPTALGEYGQTVLARVNSYMSTVDLLAEMFGPMVAGVLLAVTPSLQLGFVVVGFVNVISFGPQLLILLSAMRRCPRLRALRCVDKKPETKTADNSGDAKGTRGAWRVFWEHPSGVALLTMSYAFVYFTVLSSHGVILTAFLDQAGVHSVALAAFRALGAGVGVFGAVSFGWFANCFGARNVSWFYVSLQSSVCLVAAISLRMRSVFDGLAPAWLDHMPAYMVPFLVSIVLSRAGLYGFDTGFATLSQSLADERHRNTIGGVTKSLCSVFHLGMCVLTVIVTGGAGEAGTSAFEILVWASAGGVFLAMVAFTLWHLFYHEHDHYHAADGEDVNDHHGHGHGHVHAHTLQQEQSLSATSDGSYKHSHAHYRGPSFLLRLMGG